VLIACLSVCEAVRVCQTLTANSFWLGVYGRRSWLPEKRGVNRDQDAEASMCANSPASSSMRLRAMVSRDGGLG